MTALLRYDAACAALAEARSFDEVRDWEDKAAAVREYARRARNRSLEIDALEIRERARRRRGELLIELKTAGQLIEGRKKLSTADDSIRITLEQLDTTPDESSRDQKLAKMESDSFERLISRCRTYMEEHPEKHSFTSVPDGPINGARAIMGSRQEPDDSLDYFPTPPWATRALIEQVFPHLGIDMPAAFESAWEPACGEGHIAEVLKEYFGEVRASDIFDYGYGEVQDFLEIKLQPSGDNWIITNPPFGENALHFVRRALAMAPIGVAMFFRSQWAVEGIERYEEVFRDRPPTWFCPFVERVNLCKGRWEPSGTTATAYCWLVWLKNEPAGPTWLRATRVFWIPPGQREALTRPDDAGRFTAHPVIRKENFNPDTGEIKEGGEAK